MGLISNSKDGIPSTRNISAFFATRPAADAARAELVAAGLSFEAVKITDGRGTVTGRSTEAEPSAGGFIDTVKNAFAQDQPSHDAEQSRAGHVLTAHVPNELCERMEEIIGRKGEISEQA